MTELSKCNQCAMDLNGAKGRGCNTTASSALVLPHILTKEAVDTWSKCQKKQNLKFLICNYQRGKIIFTQTDHLVKFPSSNK